jgi:hypothetical protein
MVWFPVNGLLNQSTESSCGHLARPGEAGMRQVRWMSKVDGGVLTWEYPYPLVI